MNEPTSINIDSLMKLEDEEHLTKILEVKKRFSSYFDREAIIDFFIQIVNDSSCLTFERPNPKPYISRMKPSLYLLMDINKAKAKYPKLSIFEKNSDREDVLTCRSNIVHSEIVSVFMQLMETILKRIVKEDIDESNFKYSEFITKVFPHDFVEMQSKINNILDFTQGKDASIEELMFIYGMTSAVVFPEVDLDNDTGLTLEFMI